MQCLSGNSFAFDNASTSSQTYLWSFGDGTTSTLGIPTPKTYSAVGTYTIKLVATNVNGCKDSLSRNVIVVKSPKAAFNAVYQTCGGLFVQFKQIDTTTTKFSVWDFGDGSTPVNDVFNTTHFYSTFGTYTIKYYAYDATSTCIDSATKTITLTNSPAASIHNSTNAKQCLNGNSFNFSSNSLFATSYAWTFGDGSTSSLQNPAPKVYSNPGIYTVKLTVSNSLGCTSTTTIQDTVLTNPKANFNVIYQPCNRANIKFIQIDTTGTKYSAWDFGDGNGASDVFNTTHSYASINSFNIKYYAYDNNFYCLDSATKTITFSDIPAAGIGYPYTSKQCFNGNSFAHTNTSIGASSYLWEFGDGSTSTAVTPPAKTFVTPGIYTVKLTVFNASGCIGSTTVL
ncbi:MAG: PKD domain-containing protein, partial [Bacteroidetes bacterium]|nr:PKD domain-containing protein [Bacteroidota bacterium]